MRHGENIYQVVSDDKVIFEGTAREICVHFKGRFNPSDVRYIYKVCADGITWFKKYRIKLKEKRKIKIEITNEKTNEVFVGTVRQVAEKLWLCEAHVLRTARINGRLLWEWKARIVEN